MTFKRTLEVNQIINIVQKLKELKKKISGNYELNCSLYEKQFTGFLMA